MSMPPQRWRARHRGHHLSRSSEGFLDISATTITWQPVEDGLLPARTWPIPQLRLRGHDATRGDNEDDVLHAEDLFLIDPTGREHGFVLKPDQPIGRSCATPMRHKELRAAEAVARELLARGALGRHPWATLSGGARDISWTPNPFGQSQVGHSRMRPAPWAGAAFAGDLLASTAPVPVLFAVALPLTAVEVTSRLLLSPGRRWNRLPPPVHAGPVYRWHGCAGVHHRRAPRGLLELSGNCLSWFVRGDEVPRWTVPLPQVRIHGSRIDQHFDVHHEHPDVTVLLPTGQLAFTIGPDKVGRDCVREDERDAMEDFVWALSEGGAAVRRPFHEDPERPTPFSWGPYIPLNGRDPRCR